MAKTPIDEFLDSISELSIDERIFEILAWGAVHYNGQNVDDMHRAIMRTLNTQEHLLNTRYYSLTPDGKIWTETKNLQELVEQTANRTDLTFGKTEFYKRYHNEPLDLPIMFDLDKPWVEPVYDEDD